MSHEKWLDKIHAIAKTNGGLMQGVVGFDDVDDFEEWLEVTKGITTPALEVVVDAMRENVVANLEAARTNVRALNHVVREFEQGHLR